MTVHGGTDAAGVPRWDFSTNANACGPEPRALQAVRAADPARYPDPEHVALRAALAGLHGVAADRIVIAASASEFIVRMTSLVTRRWPGAAVHAPRLSYGDYALAARAHGLARAASPTAARLVWHTQPGSPLGESRPAPPVRSDALLIVDRAYAPLRLHGIECELPSTAWQLWSPNKALGLTGVRGAYVIAPHGLEDLQAALVSLAPSWPLGAHSVAMLQAWAEDATQQWVQGSLVTLRAWKQQQIEACEALGWVCEPSDTPFYVARWDGVADAPAQLLPRLRALGLKLRDATSLGLPGHVRLSVQPPEAQHALVRLWREAVGRQGSAGSAP